MHQINAGNPGLFQLKIEFGVGYEAVVLSRSQLPRRSVPYGKQAFCTELVGRIRAINGYRSALQIIKTLLERQRSADDRSWKNGMKKWLEGLARGEDLERLS